jgi:hypothetical protein
LRAQWGGEATLDPARTHRRGAVLTFCGVTLAVIAVAPVIVLVGEPLRRHYLRRLSQPPVRTRSGVLLSRFGLRRRVFPRRARRWRPVAGRARAGGGRSRRRSGAGWRRHSLARAIAANPVLIALTAPERWVIDQVGGLSSRGFGGGRFGWRGGNWPPPAGVREPRRPKPNGPAGAIALAEPRQQHRPIPILKALPPALSEPARRVGSFLGQRIAELRVIRRQLER